ncbi:MAG: ABC transporter permease [Verrucomicrobia bacterium]|nr:MAG: ABC transporter permease [Verrucomicrobiota bacterium]
MNLRASLKMLGPLVALLVVYFGFGISEPAMFNRTVIINILSQSVIVGIAAVGMTLIIISGGIDLSVGSIIAWTGVIAAFLIDQSLSPILVFLTAILCGGLCGFLNGSLSIWLRLMPFIVTLGTMQIYRGSAKIFTGGTPINLPFDETRYQLWMGGTGFPYGIFLLLVICIFTSWILHYTRFGRHAIAIGSSPATARLCGIPVLRTQIFVYVIGGAMAGLAAMMNVAKSSQGDPTTALGLELDIIAAVVLGGARLTGGQGSVIGAVIGALLMTCIRTGCVMHGIPTPWTEVITGIIIIIAVVVDRLRQRHTLC